MKRLTLLMILMLAMPVLMGGICNGKKPPVEVPTPEPVDTEPVDTTTPPPPPPPAVLEQAQLQTVYFDLDKFALKAAAKALLDANYALLVEFPDAMVKLEGHCDERGTVEYNIALGDRRANAARDYLVGLGLAENRVSTISYGEERPAATGSNDAAWDKNRRCEFKIVSQ